MSKSNDFGCLMLIALFLANGVALRYLNNRADVDTKKIELQAAEIRLRQAEIKLKMYEPEKPTDTGGNVK